MRLLIISQYFWPEDFRVNELVTELAKRGHDVTVLTGKPNYPEGKTFPAYAADPRAYATFAGARVVRVPMVARGNSRCTLLLGYLTFALSATLFGAFKLRGQRFEAIFVFQPSPVTVGLPAIALRRLKRAPVVFWVLDQWPETLVAAGAVGSPFIIAPIGWLVSFIYRRCDLILTPSRSLVSTIRRYCAADARVAYFPNWVESVYGGKSAAPALEVERKRGTFNVMFAGNIGEAQSFSAILEAAERLKAHADIRWLILGDGRMRHCVEQEVQRRGLHERFVLLGRFPAHRMASFFCHADTLLLSLKHASLFSMTVPGKLQTYLAAGKPVIGMLDGEGADIIRDAEAGFACCADDPRSLAENILRMSRLTDAERMTMGEKGRRYSRREFDRETLMAQLDTWLASLPKRSRASIAARGDEGNARSLTGTAVESSRTSNAAARHVSAAPARRHRMPLLGILRFIANHPVNRKNKVRAIMRFAKWQIGSRLLPGPIVYDWVNGSKFLVSAGETGLTGNVYTGLCEFPDMAFVLHVLRRNDLFIDVGANVGSYTILACSAIGARGYAFEPVPATYQRLVENLRLNHLEERVVCINKGIGAEQGCVAFTNSGSNATNHALARGEASDDTIDVEVSSLDTALSDESPMLMKIDVEGYETQVLEGASETLKKRALRAVIVELNGRGRRYGFDESRILELMFDHGFKPYAYDPLDRALIGLEGKNPNSDNTLFIRDETFVLDRLRSSPAISIHGKPLG